VIVFLFVLLFILLAGGVFWTHPRGSLDKKDGGFLKDPELFIFKDPGCLGYIPNKGKLDSKNPPKGGSGVPDKIERYDIECELLRDIIRKMAREKGLA